MIKRTIAFLLFMMFAAAFFYYYWSGGLIANSTTDMLVTANSFLADLGAGRTEAAYTRTSTSFRKEHSLEQFRSLIDRHPILKSGAARQINGHDVRPTWLRGTADYNVTLVEGKQSLPVHLQLVTEEAVWKIDEVAVAAK